MDHTSITVAPVVLTDKALAQMHQVVRAAYCRYTGTPYKFRATEQTLNQTVRRALVPGTVVLGAFRQHTLIGTISLLSFEAAQKNPYVSEEGDVCLEQFAIPPEHQDTGIGFMLMRKAEEAATLSSATRIFLDTPSEASHLIRYYTRSGYKVYGDYEAFSTGQRNTIFSKIP